MDATWRPLQVAGIPTAFPPLFAKCDFSSTSYTVFMTDLSRVWRESLDRRGICKRALAEDTAIDPTEDATQRCLLLEHIKSAIDGDKGTRRQLTRHDKNPKAVSLHLTTPLPGSLGNLQWIVHLEPLSASAVEKHVVSPLMNKIYRQSKQVRDLIGQLNAKDQVISKLLDKLEGSGMDISTIFPGMAAVRGSKHSTPRERAVQQVHGLRPFHAEQWLETYKANQSDEIPSEKLSEVLSVSAPLDDAEDPSTDGWLSTLPTTVEAAVDEPAESHVTLDEDSDANMNEEASVEDEDIFERQETPPRLRKAQDPRNHSIQLKPVVARDTADDETTDDEDLNGPSSQPPMSAQKPRAETTPHKPNRLGTLGGRASTQPPNQKAEAKAALEDNDGTASETEDDADTANPPVQSTAVPLRKGKLGVIGGAKKANSSTAVSKSPTPIRRSSPEPGPAPGRIRSKIGGRNNVESPANESAIGTEPHTLRSPAKQSEERQTPVSSGPPESEQERANRKRDELKRELEKSQGPSKKKRRF